MGGTKERGSGFVQSHDMGNPERTPHSISPAKFRLAS
jgi:hypothetical protein